MAKGCNFQWKTTAVNHFPLNNITLELNVELLGNQEAVTRH
jgi:hypothetical protein